MKKIISICLCFIFLVFNTTNIFAKNAYNDLGNYANNKKRNRVISGILYTAIGSYLLTDFIEYYNNLSQPAPIGNILALSGMSAGLVCFGAGIYRLVKPSPVEKYINGVTKIESSQERELVGYKALEVYANDARKNRIGYGVFFTLMSAISLNPSAPPNHTVAGIFALLAVNSFARKSSEEKYFEKHEGKYPKLTIIAPIISPNYVGLSLSRRF